MTSQPTYSALCEYRKRIAAMLDDPECTDELFGLGVALLDFAVLRINRDERSFEHYAEKAWGRAGAHRVRGVLREDIRRYDALADAETSGPGRTCGAPMMRRQGPCGQSAGRRAMLRDPLTGRAQWLAACGRHADWFDAQVIANRTALAEGPTQAERPAANTGGVLARHIPEIDWSEVWVKIDPSWTPPPEAEPEEIPVKPRLRLVLGGDAMTADHANNREGTE